MLCSLLDNCELEFRSSFAAQLSTHQATSGCPLRLHAMKRFAQNLLSLGSCAHTTDGEMVAGMISQGVDAHQLGLFVHLAADTVGIAAAARNNGYNEAAGSYCRRRKLPIFTHPVTDGRSPTKRMRTVRPRLRWATATECQLESLSSHTCRLA